MAKATDCKSVIVSSTLTGASLGHCQVLQISTPGGGLFSLVDASTVTLGMSSRPAVGDFANLACRVGGISLLSAHSSVGIPHFSLQSYLDAVVYGTRPL